MDIGEATLVLADETELDSKIQVEKGYMTNLKIKLGDKFVSVDILNFRQVFPKKHRKLIYPITFKDWKAKGPRPCDLSFLD